MHILILPAQFRALVAQQDPLPNVGLQLLPLELED